MNVEATISRLVLDAVRSSASELGLDERPAVEYLTFEALGKQPASRRRFLLETSIVDSLTPGLADRLTLLPIGVPTRLRRS